MAAKCLASKIPINRQKSRTIKIAACGTIGVKSMPKSCIDMRRLYKICGATLSCIQEVDHDKKTKLSRNFIRHLTILLRTLDCLLHNKPLVSSR